MVPYDFRCGKCNACLATARAERTLRIILEMMCHKENSFVTLTYAPDRLPINLETFEPTLEPKHATDFIKRLRYYAGQVGLTSPRYYLCGEYGEKSGRPHLHLIIFGFSPTWVSVIEQAWSDGFVHCVPATGGAAAYVAWYTTKKGAYALSPGTGSAKEFSRCSKNPGLGFCMVSRIAQSLKTAYLNTGETDAKLGDMVINGLSVLRIGKVFYPIDRWLREQIQLELKTDKSAKAKALDTLLADKLKTSFDFKMDYFLKDRDAKLAETKMKRGKENRKL